MAQPPERHTQRLAALDIGSTTTRALVMEASFGRGAGGRLELSSARPLSAPAPVLTPFCGEDLDLPALLRLSEALGSPEGGGILLTGLAAAAPNAGQVAAELRRGFADAVVITAQDAGLEAWVAFQARARGVSLAQPQRWVVNIDIGGGTSNLAAGRAGEVERVGCLRIGARQLRVNPRGEVLGATATGRAALAKLGLSDVWLSEADRDALAALYVRCLEAALTGSAPPLPGVVELPFEAPEHPLVTLSGGVAELVHGPEQPDEAWDDLGVRLARHLRRSALLCPPADGAPPARLGGATVLGLALHSEERPGSTVYLGALPAEELPLRARRRADDPAVFADLPGAVQVTGCPTDTAGVRALARRLELALAHIPTERPVVVLVDADIGLALGNLATAWGSRRRALVVLDAVVPRPARALRLRRDSAGLLHIRYYGFAASPSLR